MMNERIRELAEQARKEFLELPTGYRPEQVGMYPQLMEKFAELIVLEMCNVLDKAQWDKGQDWVCADGTRIIPQIKQHFGVEE